MLCRASENQYIVVFNFQFFPKKSKILKALSGKVFLCLLHFATTDFGCIWEVPQYIVVGDSEAV